MFIILVMHVNLIEEKSYENFELAWGFVMITQHDDASSDSYHIITYHNITLTNITIT